VTFQSLGSEEKSKLLLNFSCVSTPECYQKSETEPLTTSLKIHREHWKLVTVEFWVLPIESRIHLRVASEFLGLSGGDDVFKVGLLLHGGEACSVPASAQRFDEEHGCNQPLAVDDGGFLLVAQ